MTSCWSKQRWYVNLTKRNFLSNSFETMKRCAVACYRCLVPFIYASPCFTHKFHKVIVRNCLSLETSAAFITLEPTCHPPGDWHKILLYLWAAFFRLGFLVWPIQLKWPTIAGLELYTSWTKTLSTVLKVSSALFKAAELVNEFLVAAGVQHLTCCYGTIVL